MMATLDFEEKKYNIDNKEINFSTNKSVLNIATIKYRFLIEDIKFSENYNFQFLKNDSIKNYSFKKLNLNQLHLKIMNILYIYMKEFHQTPKKEPEFGILRMHLTYQ